MTGPTDEQLMTHLQMGQTTALDELYRRYSQKLAVFCRYAARTGDTQEAADLAQDVFLRVIRAAHTYNPNKAAFRTWLFRIARNRCTDAIRRRARIRFSPLGPKAVWGESANSPSPQEAIPDLGPAVEEAIAESLLIDAVRDCIDELQDESERLPYCAPRPRWSVWSGSVPTINPYLGRVPDAHQPAWHWSR